MVAGVDVLSLLSGWPVASLLACLDPILGWFVVHSFVEAHLPVVADSMGMHAHKVSATHRPADRKSPKWRRAVPGL